MMPDNSGAKFETLTVTLYRYNGDAKFGPLEGFVIFASSLMMFVFACPQAQEQFPSIAIDVVTTFVSITPSS